MGLILRLSFAIGIIFATTARAQPTAPVEYLADHPELIMYAQQGWGELGINVSAHAPGQTPLKLAIKDKNYARGLGHHAPGEIIIELAGRYSRFEAEVGVQNQPTGEGSVVFQVFVDDQKKFDSGVMRGGEAAKAISVALSGADELRLVVTDAGDGINCDCADWAEARLTRNPGATTRWALDRFDVAKFGRVITCDPTRMDGARSNRIQEYRTEDVFLDKEVEPTGYATYIIPDYNGIGCIGLQWTERRHIRELEIGVDSVGESARQKTQVQYWAGESPWQGRWKPLKGTLQADRGRLRFSVDPAADADLRRGTWKVRWLIPTDGKRLETTLLALTPVRLSTTELRIEMDGGVNGDIAVYNGETAAGLTKFALDSSPLTIGIQAIKRRPRMAERTILHFRLPQGGFGVAVDDVLEKGAVYVPAYGVLVCRADVKTTLRDYRDSIAGRETILQQVRQLPDQTLAQAMARVHHSAQDMQPTMLSLACDNHKFIVNRDGTVHCAAPEEKDEAAPADRQNYAYTIKPTFGSGKNLNLSRHLDGGWLPAPVTQVSEDGIAYTMRSFVAPWGQLQQPENPWLGAKSLFVSEFTVENSAGEPRDASMRLKFDFGNINIVKNGGPRWPRLIIRVGDRPIALLDANTVLRIQDDGVALVGEKLNPHEAVHVRLLIPGWRITGENAKSIPGGPRHHENLKSYWNHIFADTMQITVPDPLLMHLIRASQVHCLIAARNEDAGRRIAPWIASVSYGPLESESNSIIRGMDMLGHHQFAQRSLDYFIHRYNPAGFLTTGYTLMGTGWHLWTLGEHYQLTRDREWMKQNAGRVAQVCSWIEAQRKKTRATGDGPMEWGLMPPGVIADWNAFAYYFCLNGYYCAGLRSAAEALKDIGRTDADTMLGDAQDFRRDILRAYHAVQAQMPVFPLRNGTFVPGYPSQLLPGPTALFFPGEDGNRSWCYDVEAGAQQLVPQGILPADSRDVAWMMDHMEDVQFLADGWFDYPAAESQKDPFDLGGFSKVQPYYTRNGEIYAMRDEVKPFVRSYFNTLASLLNAENLSFQEHFHGAGAWNKTHETGYFLQQTRFMLVMERGDELWLAPLVTNNWLKDGMMIDVKNAPTRFGPVSFRIASSTNSGFIEATISPPQRSMPEQIVLRLRHPDGKPEKSVTIDGREHRDFDAAREIVRIPPRKEKITVRADY